MAIDYGLDLSGTDDLDPGMVEVTGRIVLSQALVRRLITPRGALCDDPNYGYDVTRYINDDMTARDVAMVLANVKAECQKDERVLDASVSGGLSVRGVLTMIITITDLEGPFDLVLAATDVSVTVLKAA